MTVANTTDLDSFKTKYGLSGLSVPNSDALYQWILNSYVFGMREAGGNYYLITRRVSDIDSLFYQIQIIFLDTTAESVELKKEYQIKSTSFLDLREISLDFFSVIV